MSASSPKILLVEDVENRGIVRQLGRRMGWTLLKADPETSGIPIVALTAHAMAGEEQRARSIGMDGDVTQPISLMPFRDLLESLVSEGRVPHAP